MINTEKILILRISFITGSVSKFFLYCICLCKKKLQIKQIVPITSSNVRNPAVKNVGACVGTKPAKRQYPIQ
ncbi:hypothetical protein PPL_01609 [Heterostelium album PN500]|uniref:Uncharacterized protein n=1 Tax=Heterostelium pallidum (strain ATCC 26659 / Pp 5 / PN500) TaxID=670386 RepID=D3AZZ5_HETP5|nr:hypothetical protein PPL_01609 [Heterostelium album PN500]EFA84619.1 hypothetical protein PPL_01609 [Heterostelium album PN500]|eukprot:XP_020436732.1 hypothetical protein PPL_01609 [Heterostelium album PN500]